MKKKTGRLRDYKKIKGSKMNLGKTLRTDEQITDKIFSMRDYYVESINRSRRKIKAISKGKTSFEGWAILNPETSLIFEVKELSKSKQMLAFLDRIIYEDKAKKILNHHESKIQAFL